MTSHKKLLVIAWGNYIFGAEKVTLDVMEGLKAKGYDMIALVSGWGDGRFVEAIDKMDVKYYRLKLGWYYLRKLLWSLDSLVHYPGALIRFLRIRKQFRDWPVYIISFRQVIMLWPFFRKNIIYHVHDPYSRDWQSRFFIRRVDRKVLKYIAVSNFIKRDLVACGIAPEKIVVIHNGVEVTHPLPPNIDSAKPLRIGIVGQVIQRKGHEDLIEAVSILRKKGIPLSVIIAGKGEDSYITLLKKVSVEKQVADIIEWRSYREQKQMIYEGMDLVAVPSRTDEPFALVVLEANMFSIPVVATTTGGFPESITEGENGYLVQPCRPLELAEKIERLYSDRILLKQMGEKGRIRALHEFTSATMIDAIDDLIRSI